MGITLGYLLIQSPQPAVFQGGILLTDDYGIPVEFRYTDPVQPAKLQQLLYGKTLSQYVKRQVVVDTLLASLDSAVPAYLFVGDESLVGTYRPGGGAKGQVITTLLRLSETQMSPIGEPGSKSKVNANEYLIQCDSLGSPVRLLLPEAQTEAEPQQEVERMYEPLLEALVQAGKQMELTEPFRRIEKLLASLYEEASPPSAVKMQV